MFRFPFGTTQELNLDWFLEQWEIFKQEAQTALDGIDHALDDEIQRVEDAMADLYAARDAAIAAKNNALDYAQSANDSAIGASQSAQNSAASAVTSAQQAQSATQSATSAQSSATNAGTSAGNALSQAQQSEAWATGEIGGVHVPPSAPQNLNNAKQYATNAQLSANAANTAKNDARVYSQDSKAWATGIRNGQPVTSEDETYQNNAKYYAESIAGDAAAAAQSASEAATSATSVGQSLEQIAQSAVDIVKIVNNLNDYNNFDLLSILQRNNVVRGGLTWEWDSTGKQISVSGTATNLSFTRLWNELDGMPPYFKKGATYAVHYKTTDAKVRLHFVALTPNGKVNTYFTTDGVYTVPSDTTAMTIRLVVSSTYIGSTIDAVVSDIALLNTKPKTKIAFFGDSIVQGSMGAGNISPTTIPMMVEMICGVPCTNFGVGSIGYPPNGDKPPLAEYASEQDLTGYTHVVCFAGDNAATNFPLGTYEDIGNTTNMGYVYQFINTIKQAYPNMIVILISKNTNLVRGTFPRYRNGVKNLYNSSFSYDDENAEIEKLCDYYRVGFISTDRIGFDSYMVANYIASDNIHFTEAGYIKLGECIANALKAFIA